MRFTTKKGYGVWQVVDAENQEWYCVRRTKRLADTLAERLNECCDDIDALEYYMGEAVKSWTWKFPNKKGGGRPKGQDPAEFAPPSNVPQFVEIDGDQPFGPQAKQIRLASGAGRSWVAEKSGLKLGTVSHWEQNTGSYARVPGTKTELLIEYLRALGVGRVVVTFNLL